MSYWPPTWRGRGGAPPKRVTHTVWEEAGVWNIHPRAISSNKGIIETLRALGAGEAGVQRVAAAMDAAEIARGNTWERFEAAVKDSPAWECLELDLLHHAESLGVRAVLTQVRAAWPEAEELHAQAATGEILVNWEQGHLARGRTASWVVGPDGQVREPDRSRRRGRWMVRYWRTVGPNETAVTVLGGFRVVKPPVSGRFTPAQLETVLALRGKAA